MTDERDDLAEELADARLTIERQADEIEKLRASQADSYFADAIRESLITAASAAAIGSPASHGTALEHIVETASDVLNAQAASLFLLDEEAEELVFVVALGSKADEVKQFRVPLGRGIAGYVASIGEAIAVADAEKDPRFAREIGEAIDYIPQSILCGPLHLGERLIGVLEVMDKEGGASFLPKDMGTLGRFAKLAALTVDESRLTDDVRHLFRGLVTHVASGESLTEAARKFAARAAYHAENADAIHLAALIQKMNRQSEGTRRLAIEVLESLLRYASSSAS